MKSEILGEKKKKKKTYLEDSLHVIRDSREPIIALFACGANRIRARNSGVRKRVKDALGSTKQLGNRVAIRVGE